MYVLDNNYLLVGSVVPSVWLMRREGKSWKDISDELGIDVYGAKDKYEEERGAVLEAVSCVSNRARMTWYANWKEKLPWNKYVDIENRINALSAKEINSGAGGTVVTFEMAGCQTSILLSSFKTKLFFSDLAVARKTIVDENELDIFIDAPMQVYVKDFEGVKQWTIEFDTELFNDQIIEAVENEVQFMDRLAEAVSVEKAGPLGEEETGEEE